MSAPIDEYLPESARQTVAALYPTRRPIRERLCPSARIWRIRATSDGVTPRGFAGGVEHARATGIVSCRRRRNA